MIAVQPPEHTRQGNLISHCEWQEAILEANQERDSNLQQHEAQQAEQQHSIEALQAQVLGTSCLWLPAAFGTCVPFIMYFPAAEVTRTSLPSHRLSL